MHKTQCLQNNVAVYAVDRVRTEVDNEILIHTRTGQMIKHHLKEYTNGKLAEALAKLDNGISPEGRICLGYAAHVEGMKIQREYSEHYSDLINNMETKKPMKALLILVPRNGTEIWRPDPLIEVESAAKAMVTALDWMEDNNMPRSILRYIFVDGMLFEYTSKPVLAEVGTGIEI